MRWRRASATAGCSCRVRHGHGAYYRQVMTPHPDVGGGGTRRLQPHLPAHVPIRRLRPCGGLLSRGPPTINRRSNPELLHHGPVPPWSAAPQRPTSRVPGAWPRPGRTGRGDRPRGPLMLRAAYADDDQRKPTPIRDGEPSRKDVSHRWNAPMRNVGSGFWTSCEAWCTARSSRRRAAPTTFATSDGWPWTRPSRVS